MSYYPYGLVSPQRSVYPQVYYPQTMPQQRQGPHSMPNQMYRQPPVVRPPPQPYYPQYHKPNQFAPPTNYGQSPIKSQPTLQQSYPTNQQNPRQPNYPPQIFKSPQQPVVRPIMPQYQIPAQQRGTAQYNYQPQQQQIQKSIPQQYNPNQMVSPPKQTSQQLPTQTKPQPPPSQHKPQSQQQQNLQSPQQQVNKPPQQQKQPQISQKDDDLEKKFQDAIDRTRDLVQKYQNPQQKQPQQQQVEQQQQQPKLEQPTDNPQDNNDQLQDLALQYEDGYIYRGQGIEPATREGYGILTDQNDNTVYDGQWKDNQYHGQGKLINVQAEQFEGPFDYQDLSVIENGWLGYEGDFSEGKMNGFGRLQLTNGEVFEGQFNDGMIHGEGIYSAINGLTIKGFWQEGVLTQVFA